MHKKPTMPDPRRGLLESDRRETKNLERCRRGEEVRREKQAPVTSPKKEAMENVRNTIRSSDVVQC